MGTQERKERDKLELRESILEASKKILLQNGKEGLSIRKIAAEIEYSPGTIYTYYKDKDAILHELMERGFDLLNKFMSETYKELDPAIRLHKIGVAYVKFALQHKDWYDIMFNSASPMKHIAECREDWDKGMAMFAYLMATCGDFIEKSGRSGLKSDILALQMWSNVHGLVNLAQTGRLEIVRDGEMIGLLEETIESISMSVLNMAKSDLSE
jgi:AcrR family transcriptional regulator